MYIYYARTTMMPDETIPHTLPHSTMSPQFTSLLLLILGLSATAVSAYPTNSGHGHDHGHALANGQSCDMSVSIVVTYGRVGLLGK